MTRQHIEIFIYWMITCWARKSTARKGIKYSQYKPLARQSMDDSRHSDVESQSDVTTDEDTSSENADRDYARGMWLRSCSIM